MPEISRFFGIIIAMYYDDHAPPHFHAKYGEYEMTVSIADGAVVGNFPGRAKGLVIEWLHLHKDDLSVNWVRAENHEPLQRIPPLE